MCCKNSHIHQGRIHAALARPLIQRCRDVNALLQDTSFKELYAVVPVLIESIFGFNGQAGWSISICRSQHEEYREFKYLLGPSGPLLSVIYKMCSDPYLKYEFPVSCLPLSTQRSIESGQASAFFASKVQITSGGRPHNMLRLNPFEYYFFHFTHYLVGSTEARDRLQVIIGIHPNGIEHKYMTFSVAQRSTWSNPADALYPMLLEDYMNYFLPLDTKAGPPPVMTGIHPGIKSPIVHSPYSPTRQTLSPSSQRASPFSGLLRMNSNTSGGQGGASSPGNNVTNDALEDQTWRTQSFLQVLIEQWMSTSGLITEQISLNQTSSPNWRSNQYLARNQPSWSAYNSPRDQKFMSRDFFTRDPWSHDQNVLDPFTGSRVTEEFPRDTAYSSRDSFLTSRDIFPMSPMNDPYHHFIAESYLPSIEQIRLVRMFLKHVHYFANTAPAQVVTSSNYSANTSNPWNDFKRAVIPQFVQRHCYHFLKHCFERWPLDSSFRMVMECWLSYIQPWRYIEPGQSKQRENESSDMTVDHKWRDFVFENLLFYTVLFESFVQRSLRLDLCTPKSANLVFRVAKIFSLPNLREYIEEAEQSQYASGLGHSSMQSSFHGHASHSMTSLRHHQHQHQLHLAHSTRTLPISELEGPMFVYQPMFGEDTARMVLQLIHQLVSSKQNIKDSNPKPSHNNSSFLSFLGFGGSADFNATSVSGYDYDEFGYSAAFDSKKLTAYVEQAITNLCKIYDFEASDYTGDKTDSSGGNSKGDVCNMNKTQTQADTLTPDVYMGDRGPQLTPLGRYQIINGLRKFDVAYEGDPDTQPIRSFESPILVRATYEIASWLNKRFADEIHELYNRDDFKARAAQQYITLPFPDCSPASSSTSSPSPSSLHLSPLSKQKRAAINTPRISLRWLANYQSIGYLLAFYVFLYMWFGFGLSSTTVLLVVLFCLYGPIMALFRSTHRPSKMKNKSE